MSELKNCPFCGCKMHIKIMTRDWYKLQGDHDESCFFEADDCRLQVTQYDERKEYLINDWNTRAPAIPADLRSMVLELCDLFDGRLQHTIYMHTLTRRIREMMEAGNE